MAVPTPPPQLPPSPPAPARKHTWRFSGHGEAYARRRDFCGPQPRLGLPVLVAGMCVNTRVWMLAHTCVCGCPRSFSKSIPQFCPRVDHHRQEEEHLSLLYLKKPNTSQSAAAKCWEHVRIPQGCSEGVPVRVSDRDLGCGSVQGGWWRVQAALNGVLLMPTTRPLGTGAESNRRDRAWGK